MWGLTRVRSCVMTSCGSYFESVTRGGDWRRSVATHSNGPVPIRRWPERQQWVSTTSPLCLLTSLPLDCGCYAVPGGSASR